MNEGQQIPYCIQYQHTAAREKDRTEINLLDPSRNYVYLEMFMNSILWSANI